MNCLIVSHMNHCHVNTSHVSFGLLNFSHMNTSHLNYSHAKASHMIHSHVNTSHVRFGLNKFRFLYNGLLNRTLGQSTIVDCYRDERNSLFRLSLRLVDVVDFMGTWKQHVKCCYFNCLYLNYLCMSCVHANSQMNCLYEKSLWHEYLISRVDFMYSFISCS